MSEHNGSDSGMPAPPGAGIRASDMDAQLRLLAGMLRQRGLRAQLVSYLTDGVRNAHYDAVNVTNPAAPERGSMQIEKVGLVTWEFSGSLDDAGVGRLADEAANTLRASGKPRPEAAT
jgi:hypothetical protein